MVDHLILYYYTFIWTSNFITIYAVWKFSLRSTWGWPCEAETCCAEKKGLILIKKVVAYDCSLYI
jgi:hypothetical protein